VAVTTALGVSPSSVAAALTVTLPAVDKVMAPVYLVAVVLVSGLDPSVVYKMTALAVVSAMVTVLFDPMTRVVPLAGVITGVATVAAELTRTVTVAAVAAA